MSAISPWSLKNDLNWSFHQLLLNFIAYVSIKIVMCYFFYDVATIFIINLLHDVANPPPIPSSLFRSQWPVPHVHHSPVKQIQPPWNKLNFCKEQQIHIRRRSTQDLSLDYATHYKTSLMKINTPGYGKLNLAINLEVGLFGNKLSHN